MTKYLFGVERLAGADHVVPPAGLARFALMPAACASPEKACSTRMALISRRSARRRFRRPPRREPAWRRYRETWNRTGQYWPSTIMLGNSHDSAPVCGERPRGVRLLHPAGLSLRLFGGSAPLRAIPLFHPVGPSVPMADRGTISKSFISEHPMAKAASAIFLAMAPPSWRLSLVSRQVATTPRTQESAARSTGACLEVEPSATTAA